jgi:large subunit ribosomal protein L21e
VRSGKQSFKTDTYFTRDSGDVMKRSHGVRRGTRKSLRKKRRSRGKVPVAPLIQKFKLGETVLISPDPSVHKGMPHRRFFHKHAKVKAVRGRSYIIEVKDKSAIKELICSPFHLKKVI